LLKSRLRTEIRQRRQAIDATARRSLDQAINQTLLELVEKTGSASLSAFLPFDGEPDVRPALEILSQRGVQIVLPVIIDAPTAPRLQFRCWHPAMRLDRNFFGIEEPGEGEVVLPQDLDLVLLPLVAWDEYGRRLGMGAGYYDRALEPVADRSHPLRVGIAYEVQKVLQLPADPWDVRLHQLITENGRFTCTA
jgi:5-formyltetrahydrofolate cyclo-ligase